MVEVALFFLKKGVKLCSVNKTLCLFLQPKLRHWKNECKVCPWIRNPGKVACIFSRNMNHNIFNTLDFSEKQAKILRLLATVYVEWDCQRFQEKALNAVNLANKVGTSAALGFTAAVENVRKTKSPCLFLGVYEHVWAVLEDQDTPEMWGLGRRHQSRLVP